MLKELNPIIHSQLRLAIMTLLVSVEEADFSYAGYIQITKEFVGKKTRTTCRLTEEGKLAMEEYIKVLKSYLSL